MEFRQRGFSRSEYINLLGGAAEELPMNIRHLPLLPIMLLLLGACAHAEILFETTFSSLPNGEVRAGQKITDHVGVASFWLGPKGGEYGRFGVVDATEVPDTESGKSVLAFYDSGSEKAVGPVFAIRLSREPESTKTVVVEAKMLVPIKGPYLGLIGIGRGSWTGAAAVLPLSKGKITTWQPGEVITEIGGYTVNTWFVVQVRLDLTKKTYDTYVDGTKTGSAMPWAHTNDQPLTYFEFVADLLPMDRMGDAVLYLSHVKISEE